MKTVYLIFSLHIGLIGTPAKGAETGTDEHRLASAATTNQFLSLEQVINEVLVQNPALKAERAEWEAMKQRIPQAKAWEDLRGGVDIERSGTTRFDSFMDAEWMLMQEIPISGKNRLRGKAATAEAVAAFENFRRRQLDAIAQARAAYYRLANGYEQLAIVEEHSDLLRQFVGSAQTRYEVGKQTQGSVLLAESDLARLTETRFDVLRSISDAESQLNILMNRAVTAPLGKPAKLSYFPVEVSFERLRAAALAQRPEILAAAKNVDAAKARVDLAKRVWIPDPEIRVEGRQFSGRGGIQEYDTGIFFNFPWFNRKKYKAAIEEAKALRESAERQLESAQAQAGGLVRDQLKKVETLRHHTQLFRERLVPLAQQAVTSTQASYETEKSGLLDLIIAQRTALETQSMYWNHMADYLISLAELEALIGTDIRPLESSSKETSRSYAPSR